MRTRIHGRRRRWPALAGVAALTLAAGACGGGSAASSDGDRAGTPKQATTTTSAPTDRERPEGAWTFVVIELARNDAPDLEPGLANVSLSTLDPVCSTGPCDLEVAPAGANGTYLPEGVVTIDEPSKEAFTYGWDEKTETYLRTSNPKLSSCTNAKLEVVQDAYTVTRSTSMKYRPATDDRPAALEGTATSKIEGTEAGVAAGCTPFETTTLILGTPSGAPADMEGLDLAGTYVTTEAVSLVEPSGQKPPGFQGSLGRFEVTAVDDGYTVKGLIGDAELAVDGDGFSGSTDEVERSCLTTPETPKGFRSTERFTRLTPVALTKDGDPILAGEWRLLENPTPAGVAAGCSLATNTGSIVLVPVAVIE